ncbi:DUF2917 domain-containing protein [Paraburkholderia sp. Ac-20336]|uniref:DUF2917 domain-containing protein n=1 Tax=unclassified Paraburkholderia TaxID=2615204 RepID=UPI00198173BD|nr:MULTISPECIES: DUF2917 domain-containing protein [unclassified Paraburkholderia]MBN3804943.1 DUF2917 domain-containing protein [Paraburkholderia sp. Ac-20336]MBN3851163.1 DUF2917 domain-containing protein [Paraburkholderia sp. Ac-20342]
MREISSSIAYEVRTGETLPLRVARSTKLTVRGGAVWITRSDDTLDYWLQPGQTLHLRRGERLWLGAEGAQHAKVTFSVPTRCDERALNWLARVGERLVMRMRGGWRTV